MQRAYQLKSVEYLGSTRKILLQNENGPCPLLAAANALLLRGRMHLNPACIRNGVASAEEVINILADVSSENASSSSSSSSNGDDNHIIGIDNCRDREYHLDEVLDILPNLQRGMDVNPRFDSGPTGAEYTRELAAFDLLGVELVHGWLLDPQDVVTSNVVSSRTYNELIEAVIMGNEAGEDVKRLEGRLIELEGRGGGGMGMTPHGEDENDRTTTTTTTTTTTMVPPRCGDASETELLAASSSFVVREGVVGCDDTNLERSRGENTSAGGGEGSSWLTHEWEGGGGEPYPASSSAEQQRYSRPDVPPSERDDDVMKDDSRLRAIADIRERISDLSLRIARSEVVNDFLTSSGHQLTHHGLMRLHEHVREGALCVFFRNNHFATLTKQNGVLYLLVTDLGYANAPEIVWEKLDDIDGDTEYVNENFLRPTPRQEMRPADGPTMTPESLLARRNQTENDYRLALAMNNGGNAFSRGMNDEDNDDDDGRLMDAVKELSLKVYRGEDDAAFVGIGAGNNFARIDSDMEMAMAYQRERERSEHESEQLARQLQELEYAREQRSAAARQQARARPAESTSALSNCTIS
ncbi:hypothetical protein ACHAXA_004660 [Cyclostephanos tholiformis]|uniref:MINDY deubiquitinase domain-containing protein n=1 Tax=Cyclostephanos tholiformis TaxID=382380 RepID=A0ABD3RBP1_9STRA